MASESATRTTSTSSRCSATSHPLNLPLTDYVSYLLTYVGARTDLTFSRCSATSHLRTGYVSYLLTYVHARIDLHIPGAAQPLTHLLTH